MLWLTFTSGKCRLTHADKFDHMSSSVRYIPPLYKALKSGQTSAIFKRIAKSRSNLKNLKYFDKPYMIAAFNRVR